MNKRVAVTSYDSFYAYLGELEENYLKLSDLLQEKLIALETEDTGKLDSILKEEQVFVLISKGFEGNLKQYREELGFTGQRLSEVIDEMPDGEHPRFRLRFQKLYASLMEAKALEDKCRSLLEERLQAVEKAMREMQKEAAPTYDNTGSQPGKEKPRLLKTSI